MEVVALLSRSRVDLDVGAEFFELLGFGLAGGHCLDFRGYPQFVPVTHHGFVFVYFLVPAFHVLGLRVDRANWLVLQDVIGPRRGPPRIVALHLASEEVGLPWDRESFGHL